MVCDKCGKTFADDAKFCPHCGAEVRQKVMYCTNCGRPLDPSKEFCMGCGKRVREKEHSYKNVNFVEAYKRFWKKGLKFEGRASLSEYWFAILWNVIINMALVLLLVVFTLVAAVVIFGSGENTAAILLITLLACGVYELATLIPTLALTVRRLHDTGKSGFYVLIGLIPFGSIVLLVFLCEQSDPNENEYD